MFLKKEKNCYILDGKRYTKGQLIKKLKEIKSDKVQNGKNER